MKLNKNLIANTDTTKAVMVPTNKIAISLEVKVLPSAKNWSTLIALPPTIAGIDKKKENSAEAVLDNPNKVAPKIVEPLRDVPGTNAKHWIRPMKNAVL